MEMAHRGIGLLLLAAALEARAAKAQRYGQRAGDALALSYHGIHVHSPRAEVIRRRLSARCLAWCARRERLRLRAMYLREQDQRLCGAGVTPAPTDIAAEVAAALA